MFSIQGVVLPTLPWCVGPLAAPAPISSFPPEVPLDQVPNDINVMESDNENSGSYRLQNLVLTFFQVQCVKPKEPVSLWLRITWTSLGT